MSVKQEVSFVHFCQLPQDFWVKCQSFVSCVLFFVFCVSMSVHHMFQCTLSGLVFHGGERLHRTVSLLIFHASLNDIFACIFWLTLTQWFVVVLCGDVKLKTNTESVG